MLLAGQGPYLRVFNANGTTISLKRIFKVQPILGVKVDRDVNGKPTHYFHFLAWGGSLLRLGRLKDLWYFPDFPDEFLDLCLTEQQSFPDWILDAVFHERGVFVLTAHNQLFEVPIVRGNAERPTDQDKTLMINGPKAFLYSGALFVTDVGSVIVASGTVFGEILVWTCGTKADDRQLVVTLRYVFKSHVGSVFGVSISQPFDLAGILRQWLSSCSDDRTIKIWDISDCDRESYKASRVVTSNQTGFGHMNEANEAHVTSAWGHLSRIWDVDFVQGGRHSSTQGISLLSRGEDGVCQLWTLESRMDREAKTGTTTTLTPGSSVRHHFGKNAWSMCKVNDDQDLVVYSGGADGQIISRRFDDMHTTKLRSSTITVTFREITATSLPLKHYQLVNHNECLATTDQGQLFRFTMANGKLQWRQMLGSPSCTGVTLYHIEEFAFTLIAPQKGGLYGLLNGQESLIPVSCELNYGISWMQMAGQHGAGLEASTTCVIAVLTNNDAVVLWVNFQGDSAHTNRTTLILPDTFTITACRYDQYAGVLILGSRAGALAVYFNVTPELTAVEQSYCFRHLHGTDSVTSISTLQRGKRAPPAALKQLHLLTTGRDGHYAIHRLEWPSSASSTQPQVAVLHLSSPPFGPNIEGAYFAAPQHAASTNEVGLILYGFRSTSFVVWDEIQQSELLTVECGGAHRNWSFKDHFITAINGDMKSFVWTKAAKLNWHYSHGSSHKVIQSGGHGREIKALARSPLPLTDGSHGSIDRALVATGAEDTNIRLFVLSASDARSRLHIRARAQPDQHGFLPVATLKGHTTGLQRLQFSPCGQYLFSSAGCEEFYAWKLSFDVPCIGVGVVLWDMMPTEEEDFDARIMSFDLSSANSIAEGDSQKFTFAIAYSNGKTKVVRYNMSSKRNQGTFEKLREINYGYFCLMQIFFLSASFEWPAGSVKHVTNVLSAGTNGYLNLSSVDDYHKSDHSLSVLDTGAPPAMEAHKVHQSSILAMANFSISFTLHLIATGGDDNGLGLTLLTCSSHSSSDPGWEDAIIEEPRSHFRTLLIPNAHAAAITAIKIANMTRGANSLSALVISASNDQRVKVWWVEIDLAKVAVGSSGNRHKDRLFEAMQVKLAGSAWTSVADVSGLEIANEHLIRGDGKDRASNTDSEGEISVLIVGVGMEQLCIGLPSKSEADDRQESLPRQPQDNDVSRFVHG